MPKHSQTPRGQAALALSSPSLLSSAPAHIPPAVKGATQGGGQSLDKHTQAEMSAKFGHDFSSIRIHTDSRAGDAADTMGANAFALGSDVVFGAGKYQPGSSDTDRLLAHELTHVVQQAQFGPGDWGRTSAKGDASEREADSLASQVMMGRSVKVGAAPGAAVARDGDDLDGGSPLADEPLPGGVSTPPVPDDGVALPGGPGPAPNGSVSTPDDPPQYQDPDKCYSADSSIPVAPITIAPENRPDMIMQGHPEDDAQRKQRQDLINDFTSNPTEPNHMPAPEQYVEEPPPLIGD